MKKISTRKTGCSLAQGSLFLTVLWAGLASAQQPPQNVRVSVQWAQEGATSTSVSTLMAIPEPPIRKGRPLHEPSISALRQINASFIRYMPYCTHPRLSIPELQPPAKDRTFWDFSLIDPDMVDFLEATKGRKPIIDFGPIPSWMFKGGDSVVYASDPDKTDWPKCGFATNPGTAELIDPTGQQVADYFARIASWYTQGGFTDELGQYHQSGYHYELPWWGVLNEPDLERALTPEQYTRIYDAVVAAVHKVSPATRFDGMELAGLTPQFIEYFLDPSHHAAGTPLDMVSLHFYAIPSIGQTLDSWQYTVFDQLSGLIAVVPFVDSIRNRLSPKTLINLGELGTYLPQDVFAASGTKPVDTSDATPALYWNLAAAFYADAFIELSKLGVDVVSASQLIGYPPEMFPSIRLIDLKFGTPLPRLQVLRLLTQHLLASRVLVQTESASDDIAAQAFRTEQGRKLLLINKRNRSKRVMIESTKRVAGIEIIDESGMSESRPSAAQMPPVVLMRPFAVGMVTFKN